jgi:hypothetical protein
VPCLSFKDAVVPVRWSSSSPIAVRNNCATVLRAASRLKGRPFLGTELQSCNHTAPPRPVCTPPPFAPALLRNQLP